MAFAFAMIESGGAFSAVCACNRQTRDSTDFEYAASPNRASCSAFSIVLRTERRNTVVVVRHSLQRFGDRPLDDLRRFADLSRLPEEAAATAWYVPIRSRILVSSRTPFPAPLFVAVPAIAYSPCSALESSIRSDVLRAESTG